jgi:hypothetical protein
VVTIGSRKVVKVVVGFWTGGGRILVIALIYNY